MRPAYLRHLVYCMSMFSKETVTQTCGSRLSSACGSRTEAMQKAKNNFKSVAAVVRKIKRNAASAKRNF